MSTTTGNIFAEFLEDYFAETDEHLAAARQNLLALDSAETALVQATAIANLLRSFHSLKGLSAMVGVHEITQMSHLIEEYLRDAQTTHFAPDAKVLGHLMKAVAAMEKVVESRRKGIPSPDITAVLTSLRLNGSVDPTRPALPNEAQFAVADSGPEWHFTFAPSAALAEQGINVNSVRETLAQLGSIVTASPRIVDGGIVFDFTVRSDLKAGAIEQAIPSGVSFKRVDRVGPSPTTAEKSEELTSPASSFVRVEMHKLDELMRLIGEMVISRSHFDETVRAVESRVSQSEYRALQETNSRIERQLRSLRDAVMHVRMVPIGQLFERMRFVVRGLERDMQKRVRLQIQGQDTQIDKLIVDRMSEPLLHLVRNAISHGIEQEGTVTLSARTHGEKVIIEVQDNGSGVDFEKVANKARKTGLIPADQVVDANSVLDVICAPGFSTRDDADYASGRGVGMAVVKSTIQELGGTLTMDTAKDRGTTFTVTLPLTLVILPALLVNCEQIRYALPQSSVQEIISTETINMKRLENNNLIPYRGGVLPVVAIADLLRIPGNLGSTPELGTRRHILVIGSDTKAMGLMVDKVTGQREIVVRTISDPRLRIPGIIGATELGDGRPVLILDPDALLRLGRQKKGRRP